MVPFHHFSRYRCFWSFLTFILRQIYLWYIKRRITELMIFFFVLEWTVSVLWRLQALLPYPEGVGREQAAHYVKNSILSSWKHVKHVIFEHWDLIQLKLPLGNLVSYHWKKIHLWRSFQTSEISYFTLSISKR